MRIKIQGWEKNLILIVIIGREHREKEALLFDQEVK